MQIKSPHLQLLYLCVSISLWLFDHRGPHGEAMCVVCFSQWQQIRRKKKRSMKQAVSFSLSFSNHNTRHAVRAPTLCSWHPSWYVALSGLPLRKVKALVDEYELYMGNCAYLSASACVCSCARARSEQTSPIAAVSKRKFTLIAVATVRPRGQEHRLGAVLQDGDIQSGASVLTLNCSLLPMSVFLLFFLPSTG